MRTWSRSSAAAKSASISAMATLSIAGSLTRRRAATASLSILAQRSPTRPEPTSDKPRTSFSRIRLTRSLSTMKALLGHQLLRFWTRGRSPEHAKPKWINSLRRPAFRQGIRQGMRCGRKFSRASWTVSTHTTRCRSARHCYGSRGTKRLKLSMGRRTKYSPISRCWITASPTSPMMRSSLMLAQTTSTSGMAALSRSSLMQFSCTSTRTKME